MIKEYYFEYRGGEITVIIKANSFIEALDKFEKSNDLEYKINFNVLWSDMWTYEGDELSVKKEEEISRMEEDDI
jgi:hypothetical protein